MQNKKIKDILFLQVVLLIYSLGGICSKLAAEEKFLSFKFLVLYGMVLIILFGYAILWQQILKRIPLVTAYANKAVTVIWGMVWGFLFFQETITVKKIIGSTIIIVGVYFVVSEEEEER